MTALCTVNDCRLIALPRHDDGGGHLTVLERWSELPFDVRRALVISHLPAGGTRGHSADMSTSLLVVCVAGAMIVRVDDGRSSRSMPLSTHAGALLIPPTLWVEWRDFAPGTVVVVFADTDLRQAAQSNIGDRSTWLRTRGLPRVA